MSALIQGLLLIATLLIVTLPAFAVIRLTERYLLNRHWRQVAEKHKLIFTPVKWWKVLVSKERGTLCGNYKGTPIDLRLEMNALHLEMDAGLSDHIDIESDGLISKYLPAFLKIDTSNVQTDDQQFDKSFTSKGDPTTTTALLVEEVRENLKTLLLSKLQEKRSLRIKDGKLIYNITELRRLTRNPKLLLVKSNQLVQSLTLPKDESTRNQALAARVVRQFRDSLDTAYRLRLVTMLFESFPGQVEETGILTLLEESEEPAFRWLALQHNATQSDDLSPVLALAMSNDEAKEIRLKAFDLLEEKADPDVLYQLFTVCLEANTMAIRREAKKRLKKLKSSASTAYGGWMSMDQGDELEGQLSIAAEEGGLSLTEEKEDES